MSIRVIPLGAGQDVGKSCVLVSIGNKNIMFDCGMHMGFNDARRFPDFSYISKSGRFTELLDCVIVSHFHLDHCGALPFFTEMCGYHGPVYMTHPTKAICPILLEDYRKIMVERKGEQNFFTAEMIRACMRKVVGVSLHETIRVDDELEIKAYYAGHVLGAAMFHVRVGHQSVVYTGDYNMTPDRHLGAAWIDRCQPDLLITESTYATTVRDSKRAREADLLKKVQRCVEQGGKVLIPVFALGRAQELCVLLETYWDRVHLNIKKTFADRNAFDFRGIKAWHPAYFNQTGPMVLFATPGMLHQGTSLKAFQQWSADPRNMVILPGYCVTGTVGAKVLAGQKKIDIDAFTTIEVNLQVENLSFSAHADAKGILQLIRQCKPRHVCLVHGERRKMELLAADITRTLHTPCFYPANGSAITINGHREIPIRVAKRTLLRDRLKQLNNNNNNNNDTAMATNLPNIITKSSKEAAGNTEELVKGIVLLEGNDVQLVSLDEASYKGQKHDVKYKLRMICQPLSSSGHIDNYNNDNTVNTTSMINELINRIHDTLSSASSMTNCKIQTTNNTITINDVAIQLVTSSTSPTADITFEDKYYAEISWIHSDYTLAGRVIQMIRPFFAESFMD
ncbi:beta-lactamase-like protein [Syncephalis fuscata]|nr:beta-lactamase-like protein [Syncephalis fuscata]